MPNNNNVDVSNLKSNKCKVVTNTVRMNYVNLCEPISLNDGEEPKYSVCILINKEDEKNLNKIKEGINQAKIKGEKLWGTNAPKDLKMPLRDGSEERLDQEEFLNNYFFNATSKYKPTIVDKNLNTINNPSEIYSGMYGRVSVIFYPYKWGESVGIGCGLLNVQKVSDGEYLGRSKAEDDFSIIEDSEELISNYDRKNANANEQIFQGNSNNNDNNWGFEPSSSDYIDMLD